MKRLSIILTTIIVTMAAPAVAQDSVKDLAAKAGNELRLLTAFQTLERMTSQMNHFMIYAIESERGGWGVLAFVDTTDYGTNSYVVRSTAGDVQIATARALGTIEKSKVTTPDEIANASDIEANLGALIAMAPQIADMVEAGELEEAAVLYHETGQPLYENALRSAQSGVGTVQKRLGKTVLNIRIAK